MLREAFTLPQEVKSVCPWGIAKHTPIVSLLWGPLLRESRGRTEIDVPIEHERCPGGHCTHQHCA
eukprot:1717334-Alexandrium_andersonii.AAC.1